MTPAIDEQGIDVAVLDFNLRGTTTPTWQRCCAIGASADVRTDIEQQLGRPVGNAPVLCKPIAPAVLLNAWNQLVPLRLH